MDEFEFMLVVFVLGKRVDILWNDEVIYLDLEGFYGFEEMNMNFFGEVDDYIVGDKISVDIFFVEIIVD